MTQSAHNERPDRWADLPLTLLGLAMILVGGSFTVVVTVRDVPGGLVTWSATVLAYGLWLTLGRRLVRWRRRRGRQSGLFTSAPPP